MRIWILVVSFTLLLVFAFFAWQGREQFRIEQIPVAVTAKSSDARTQFYYDQLQKDLQSKLQVFAGLPSWKIHLPELEAIIAKNPFVNKPRIRRWFTGEIGVEVEPEEMLFLTMQPDGQVQAKSRSGRSLKMVKGELPNLPFLTFDTKSNLNFNQAVELYDLLPPSGSFSHESLVEILSTKENGWVAMVSGSKGKVILGRENFKERIARATQVLDYLKEHELQWRVIDTNFSKKIVVRLRKTP